MKNKIKDFLKPLISVLRKMYYYSIDVYESAFGLREELVPPRRMIFIGKGDFKKIGEEFLQHFIKVGGLKKTDRVLDVGCGIGRMAIALTKYLSKEGSYEGFDIVKDGIKWCSKEITPRYPNFHFQLADIFNKRYNRHGKYKGSEYKFPFKNDDFDFIFLTSVFTHMLPADMENYLSEISRILKPGGKCFITWFLLNDESLNNINKKLSAFNFKYHYGEYSTEDSTVREGATAYNESFVRKLYKKYKLNLNGSVYYGAWSGRKNFLSYQDIVVAEKMKI